MRTAHRPARPRSIRPLVGLVLTASCVACAPAADPAIDPGPGAGDMPLPADAAPDAPPDAAPPDMYPAPPDMYPAPAPERADPAYLQVGSFNIDWLAAGYRSEFTPRLARDYEMITRLIVETDVEVFGLQEIEGDGALELLGLPARYRWHVGESGWSQNPAILWRSDRVRVDDAREIRLPGTDFPSKDPLAARVTHLDGDLAFTLIVVHFHPFPNAEDSGYRAHQIEQLHTWITRGLPEHPIPEPPVVIVGDFNDSHAGLNDQIPGLVPFEDDPGFAFVEDDCPESSQTRYDSRIDHLVISAGLTRRLRSDGPDCEVDAFDDRDPYRSYGGGYRGISNISSHRPLWLYLGVD